MARKTLQQRFEEKVDRSGGPDACQEWTASRTPLGYGKIRRGSAIIYAHRVAFELSIGPIPAGLCVLHRCDNPPCVNPLHLFLGTQADNMADRDRKGHSTFGEKNPNAKLTAAEVREIRALARTKTHREIARMFDVGRSSVGRIVSQKAWKSAI